MNIVLALETTEKFGSVALSDGESLFVETGLPKDRRSAQTLALVIDAIFRNNGLMPKDVDAVAVIVGPGSFTGLRVGVTTAKMFAYAVNAKILAFRTHEVIAMGFAACQSAPAPMRLSVGVDAQRGDVVVQDFHRDCSGSFAPVGEAKLISVDQWWEQAETQPETVFAGPALERWQGKTPSHVVLAEPWFWMPRAGAMIPVAFERLAKGQTDDPWTLQPLYSRPSAAEERL